MSIDQADEPITEVRPLDVTLAELAVLRAHVTGSGVDDAEGRLAELQLRSPRPTPLDRLTALLGLTDFERSVLLLAAGPDLVSATARELEEHSGAPHLTFGAALAALPDSHWSALAPDGPLRRWLLVSLDDPTHLTSSRIVLDEAVLHLIVGLNCTDPAVEAVSTPLNVGFAGVYGAQRESADHLARAWLSGPVRLSCPTVRDAAEVVLAAGDGAEVRQLDIDELSGDPGTAGQQLLRCAREALLGRSAFLVDLTGRDQVVTDRVVRAIRGMPFFATVGGPDVGGAVDVRATTMPDRVARLREAYELRGVELDPTPVGSTFDLRGDQPDRVAAAAAAGEDPWQTARWMTRVELPLARRIEPRARWDDLVLPEFQMEQLRFLASAVRNRWTVLEEWGFREHLGGRGIGISALFSGPSGTGKTFAAEVIAGELGLDLLKVDLSQVMNKYIGDTEKQLAKLFDAAERSSAVLLFDEADAVFGKRTEVKDSHDRYANATVSYLLQRLEDFTGLAILTTNSADSIDGAFDRRIGLSVTFNRPGMQLRERIWSERLASVGTPTTVDLTEFISTFDGTGADVTTLLIAAANLVVESSLESPIPLSDGLRRATHIIESNRN